MALLLPRSTLSPSTSLFRSTTPTLSLALAAAVMVPLTVAPAAGAVRDTVGAVVSLLTVTVTAADVVELPAASRATAVSVWLPFVAVDRKSVVEGKSVDLGGRRIIK